MSSILAPIQPIPDRVSAIAYYDNGGVDLNGWKANIAHNDRIVSFTNTTTGKTYYTVDALRADGIKSIAVTYIQEINFT